MAGLVIAPCGALPETGAEVKVELPDEPADLAHTDHPPRRFLRIEVLQVGDHHVPASVRVRLMTPDEPAGTEHVEQRPER